MFRLAAAAFFAASAFAVPAQAQTITLASSAPNSGINKVFVDTFVAQLGERAPDIEIEVFMDSQLGAERELIDLVRLGETTIQMGVIHSSQYYPELDATLVPYLFQSYDAVLRFLDGPIGERMEAALREKGNAVTLGYYFQGARWTTTQGRAFETVEDLDGLKIRMPKIPLWIDIWSGLGATIAPMPSKEVFSAMQAGVIDAQENMLSNIWGRRIYEVSDYLVATRHQQSYITVMINQDFWNDLNDAQRNAVQASVDAASASADAEAETLNLRIIEDIQAAGVELVEPKPAFREAALPVVEAAAKDLLAEGVWDAAVAASTETN
ncbi:MAG: TRAP transporter substrate-binding protein [Kiloniellales bacterium]